jgi:hypothetical protein
MFSTNQQHFDPSVYEAWDSPVLPLIPEPLQSSELRFERIKKALEALEISRDPRVGYQKGSLVDLRNLDPEIEIIVAGDVHAMLQNLRRILSHSNNWERALNGEVVLVLDGDLLHEEHPDRRRIMGTTIQILDLFLELKIQCPHGIHLNLGNHDLFRNNIPNDGPKSKFDQGVASIEAIKALFDNETDAENYLELCRSFLTRCPLMTIADNLAVVHAGPITGYSLEQIANCVVEDIPATSQHEIVQKANWGGFGRALIPAHAYSLEDVDSFLQQIGIPDGYLIVGHSPRREDMSEWHWKLADNHHIIFAAHHGYGYLSVKNGKFSLQQIEPNELVEIL